MSIVEIVRIAGAFGTALGLLSTSSCLTGCVMPQSAYKLGGVEPPVIAAKRTRTGFEVSVGTNFNGEAKYESTPEGALKIDVKVNSVASDVTLAQGQTAAMLAELRTIESQRIIAQQQLMNEMWGTIIQSLAGALSTALKPALPVPVP
jgi:hypothetical protein